MNELCALAYANNAFKPEILLAASVDRREKGLLYACLCFSSVEITLFFRKKWQKNPIFWLLPKNKAFLAVFYEKTKFFRVKSALIFAVFLFFANMKYLRI